DDKELLAADMLDNIMLYWLPGNATSSARLYWESVANVAPTKLANVASPRLELPVGVSIYPRETNRPSRRWVDRWMPSLIHYNILDRGGHFAAWEQPALQPRRFATASPRCADLGKLTCRIGI